MANLPEYFVPTFMEAEAITHYLEIDSSFMPEPGFYSNPNNRDIRRLAVSIVAKHWNRENTDAYIPYLAMNYFDRFASRNPDSDAKVPLVAICCLTLASKMRTASFSLDMIPKEIYNFEPNAIKRMELRILDGLEWQMRPVTPFCYLDHIYPTFLNIGGFKRRCINQIIVQAQGENRYTGQKPYDFAFACFLAAIVIWNRSKLPSTEILGERSRLHLDLAEFIRRKNIRIECAEWKKASTSKAAAAKPRGQSDSSSSSAAVVTLQGPSEGPSSSAAVVTLQGPSEGPSSSAAVGTLQGPSEGPSSSAAVGTLQGPSEGPSSSAAVGTLQGPSEGPSSSAAAATETEPDQQRLEGTETSEEIAADIGTESGQQRQEIEEISEEFADAEDVLSETESEKQRRLDRGKAVVVCEIETEDEDEEDYLAQFFQNMLERVGSRNQGIVPAAEAAAPRRLMDFDLLWPTDDPFEDECRTPTIRYPTAESLNIELEQMDQNNGCCGCCNA